MSGFYNGLQANILKINQLAQCIPWAAESLNLAGVVWQKAVLGQFRSLGSHKQCTTFSQYRHTIGQLCGNMLRTEKTLN
ncbi:hypothetical protein TNCT_230351 [Trichonephila clavata]|uniref:Uncharacterized protein n=1 Tax=Trichonephila clavata TaxID=2740835 RepID=A0A8X6LXV8_TRICU|nr:hypothetical protein TNCT_230351 [Trichonephila clavata]